MAPSRSPYVSTVLLQLVDEKRVTLDNTLSTWLPEVPNSDKVTLGQLAQMTSGYADYVQDPGFVAAVYADPFRTWTPEELAAMGTSKPLFYTPGTNWNYAHTNYVLLGLALERITGIALDRLIQQRVLTPLGLRNTADPGTPGHSRAGPARVHSGAAENPRHPPRVHAVPGGLHVLESLLDARSRGHPDHGHHRHDRDRGGHRLGQAAVGGVP